MDRAADNHYPTSPLEEIKALSVLSLAAPDCVLFLWATVPMLPQALEVMTAWGFTYKSNFAWAKNRMGTGYWNRNKHELLLIGTCGSIELTCSVARVSLARVRAKQYFDQNGPHEGPAPRPGNVPSARRGRSHTVSPRQSASG
jgi:N6-adenosine-specific RNA methylase IME4